MAQNNIIVFDCETGGLNPKENSIMELALIVKDAKTWDEIGRWESLVKDYNNSKYHPRALEVHGISISDAANNGITLEEFVATMITIFKKFTPRGDKGGGKPILAGHNVMFDVGFLEAAFNLTGQDLSKNVLSNNGRVIVFDTIVWSKFVWADEGNVKHSLGECCKRAGLGDFTAHRAMPDVVTTCDLMGYFRERFNTGNNTKTKVVDNSREIQKAVHKIKFQM